VADTKIQKRVKARAKVEAKRRGGILRVRTVSLNGKYMRVGVVRKKGPRGGRTVAGPIRTKKK
jgi:hypothetical protein